MAIAINFNHPTQLGTVKINDELIDRFLTQKFEGSELARAQYVMPDFLLGKGWIFSIGSGQDCELGIIR